MNLENLLPKGPSQKRSRWFWVGVAAAAVAVLTVVIAVPLGVLLPKRDKSPWASVILPLYVYPHDNTTWKPLYDALESRKELKFTVIVNPNSGPGNESLPNEQYREAIMQVRKYANVELLGYVRTDYAKRSLDDVIRDIHVYAGWQPQNTSLAMDGIFLDEAPHQYSANAVDFMRRVGQEIKRANGLREPRKTVHNPGVIPDARFDDTGADITVIFEHDYDTWQVSRDATVAALGPDKRDAYSLIVHSLPPTLRSGELKDFLASISSAARYLYVTTNHVKFYESFAEDWSDFVREMPA